MAAWKRIACLMVCVFLLLAGVEAATACSLPLYRRVIAIDPGHGGPDPGATRGLLKEKEIVLALALELNDLLQGAGAITYMTRRTDRDLADENPAQEGGRKRKDILRRVDLINSWQPHIALSLHANAISSSRWRGAQVFFAAHDPLSESLAESIQNSFARVLKNTNRQVQAGDYRIVNSSACPTVLIEIGFISNPDEAQLLIDATYQKKLAWAIYLGLQDWLLANES